MSKVEDGSEAHSDQEEILENDKNPRHTMSEHEGVARVFRMSATLFDSYNVPVLLPPSYYNARTDQTVHF